MCGRYCAARPSRAHTSQRNPQYFCFISSLKSVVFLAVSFPARLKRQGENLPRGGVKSFRHIDGRGEERARVPWIRHGRGGGGSGCGGEGHTPNPTIASERPNPTLSSRPILFLPHNTLRPASHPSRPAHPQQPHRPPLQDVHGDHPNYHLLTNSITLTDQQTVL